jgi:DNA-binding XRE family transcriptional regulator/molybdate-binding protein
MTSLRERREAAGLSQAELAERAEVSRATIGAVEQGRQIPAADAAVRIARAVGTTVEALFAPAEPALLAAEPVLGGPLRDGEAVRAGSVGGTVVAAPLGPDEWVAPDAVVSGGRVRLLAPGVPGGLVVAGCDPALGIAAALLGAERLVAVPATSGESLRALEAGRCHAALVHGPRLRPPAGVTRVHFARWRAGLGFDRALGSPSLEALVADVALIGRPQTAATQQAVERAARRLGLARPEVTGVADTHVDAARTAQWEGCAAVTIEPVAVRFGLGFAGLEEHAVELWVADRWVDHPGAAALVELLASSAFRDRLAPMPGYDLTASGEAA